MCICILITNKKSISEQRLREAHTANPDGWGVMWSDGEDLLTVRSTKPKYDLYKEILRISFPVVVHFRTASSGSINLKATHPLCVNDNIAFVENGNMPEFSDHFREWNDGLTDIQRFNEYFLKKLPMPIPTFALSKLKRYCERRMVKMIFMDSRGRVDIINEQAGEWVDGNWFSNGGIKHYVGYGYSGAYPYCPRETRHFGGIQSVQMFAEDERKKWAQCRTCFGWFPRAKVKKQACEGCSEWLEMMELVK